MSREFGSYHGGYFHDKIRNAAEDCREEGRDPLTKLWGSFLEEFAEVAYAISTSEAGDSGTYYPIMETIKRMQELKRRLEVVEYFVQPYQRCMEEAVRDAVLSGKKP